MKRHLVYATLTLLFAALSFGATAAGDAGRVDDFTGKPRLLVLTDIGNEPDDQMSLVRLLLYSNELDLEGLIATTSNLAARTRSAGDDPQGGERLW